VLTDPQSLYYFHADQELLAWRRIGTAARAVLELGLHRKESARKNLPDGQKRASAMRVFWCIYILDRRWSIGLSLPFTLQDADIDPETLQDVRLLMQKSRHYMLTADLG